MLIVHDEIEIIKKILFKIKITNLIKPFINANT